MPKAAELRFAFVVEDLQTTLRLFRDVFGLDVIETFTSNGGTGMILEIPAATLELFDVAYSDHVDQIEVGRPVRPRVRIAVKVDSLDATIPAVTDLGIEPLAAATTTPWGDRNQRFRMSDGQQITVFESARAATAGGE